MSYTAKIRLLLIAVAVIPPLLIMCIISFSSEKKMHQHEMQAIYNNISKTNDYIISATNEIRQNVKQLAKNRNFKTIVSSSENIVASDSRLLYSFDLDFAEVINKDAKVIRTFYRPGLLNTKIELSAPIQTGLLKTVEYDRAGRHAATTVIAAIPRKCVVASRLAFIDQCPD